MFECRIAASARATARAKVAPAWTGAGRRHTRFDDEHVCSAWIRQLTAFFRWLHRMNTDDCARDRLHRLDESATHPIEPRFAGHATHTGANPSARMRMRLRLAARRAATQRAARAAGLRIT